MDSIGEKRIVVAGAGFGGLSAALTLAKDPAVLNRGYEIILIDRNPYHLYTAGLYEVAAVPRTTARDGRLASVLRIPVSDIIRGRPIRFIRGELVGLDAARRRVALSNGGALSYAFLILALGAETNYFNIPGLKEYALPLKTADDAVALRNRIERANGEKPSLAIVIGGAGATGVELSAELINFLCALERDKHSDAPACRTTVTLIEASPDILSGCDARTVRRITRRLRDLGVIVRTEAPLVAASRRHITLNTGERLPYDILVWTGGISGPGVLRALHLPLSPKGTISVDTGLRVPGTRGRIFALGDNAWFPTSRGRHQIPTTAQVAEAHGRHAAKNISRMIRGKAPRRFRPMKKYPFVLAAGKKYAFADLVFVRCTGFPGWCVKQLIQLRYFLFLLPWRRAFVFWWNALKIYRSND